MKLDSPSMAVKTFMEQVFDTNSAGWSMPWKDSGTFGLFEVDTEFSKSRAFAFGSKFVPMSILSMLTDKPTTFFAPAKLGNSSFEATEKLTHMIYAFADNEVQGKLATSRKHKKSMESLLIFAAL